jgi:hypothetical protein
MSSEAVACAYLPWLLTVAAVGECCLYTVHHVWHLPVPADYDTGIPRPVHHAGLFVVYVLPVIVICHCCLCLLIIAASLAADDFETFGCRLLLLQLSVGNCCNYDCLLLNCLLLPPLVYYMQLYPWLSSIAIACWWLLTLRLSLLLSLSVDSCWTLAVVCCCCHYLSILLRLWLSAVAVPLIVECYLWLLSVAVVFSCK